LLIAQNYAQTKNAQRRSQAIQEDRYGQDQAGQGF
jgi:hypothetical protein